MTTVFFRWYALLSIVLLILARPSFSAQPDTAAPTPMASGVAAPNSLKRDPVAHLFAIPPISDAYLLAIPPISDAYLRADRLKMDFIGLPGKKSSGTSPDFVNQRANYSGNGFGLMTEMGDIRISETPNTVQNLSRRGGRLALQSGDSHNAVRFDTFATLGANESGSDGLLVGATGEMSLLAGTARFKAIYLGERQSLYPELKFADISERRTNVLGLVAVLEPFKEKLAVEVEADFSAFDRDTADDAAAIRDSAFRAKIGGSWQRYLYSATYERTGPYYRLIGARGAKRDSEGVALGLETDLQLHRFALRLSRHSDNVGNSNLYPRLYRYQGSLDYTFKGIQALPIALQYRKTLLDSAREPQGYLPKESDEDAFSGKVNYLVGKWDMGVHAGLSQRTDMLKEEREATAATLAFSPRYAAGPLTVAPDFSLRRSKDFTNGLQTDQYAVNLGFNGSLLQSVLDYQLGGFKKVQSGPAANGKETVGVHLKAAYPLARLFKGSRQASIGLRGEYNGIRDRIPDRRSSDFSLLFSLEGGRFL